MRPEGSHGSRARRDIATSPENRPEKAPDVVVPRTPRSIAEGASVHPCLRKCDATLAFMLRRASRMAMSARVLLVVDDARSSRALSEELVRNRFPTDVCLGMRTALEKLRLRRYDAVVLDLAVSPVDALRLAMDLRSRTDLPMVLLARDAVSRTHGLGVVEVGYPPLHDGLDLPNMRERVQGNVLRFD